MGNHFVLGRNHRRRARPRRAAARPCRALFVRYAGREARARPAMPGVISTPTGAIAAIGRAAGQCAAARSPGISVKLSALHPRFEAVKPRRG